MPLRFDQETNTGFNPRRVVCFWAAILALILCVFGCKKSKREQVLIAAMTDNVQPAQTIGCKRG